MWCASLLRPFQLRRNEGASKLARYLAIRVCRAFLILAALPTFAVVSRAALIFGRFVSFGLHRVVHLGEDAIEKTGLLFARFGCFFWFCFHNQLVVISLGSIAASAAADLFADAFWAVGFVLCDLQDEVPAFE